MKKFSALLIIFTGATLFAQTGGYTVNDLYNLALANSIERALFVNRVDQARGEKETARAGLNPTLSFSGSYSYLGFPPKGVTLEAGELGMIPIGPGIPLPSEDTVFLEDTGNNYFRLGLILDQPLYTWGKLKGAVEAARGSEMIQQAALKGEERRLHAEISTLTATLSLLQSMEEDLTAQEAIVPRLVKIVDQSLTEGFLLKEDLLEVKIVAQQVVLSRQELDYRREKIMNRLSHLTDQEDLAPSDLALTPPLSPEDIPIPSKESLIQGLISHNSDLLQLLKAVEVREELSQIASVEKTPLPNLGFRLELNYDHDTLPFSGEDTTTGLSATASLSLQGTLYDGDRNKSKWETTQAREKEARLTYERTLLNLEDKVREDVNELSLIRTRISHEKLIGEKIKEEIKVKRNLWQTGSAGEEELLKKELEGLTSSLAVKGQMIDFYTIYYSLEYMTGGDL
jgi:outer membrane protein TolC